MDPPAPIDPVEIVSLENVSVMSGGRYLLRNVDWSVKEHEHWVVLGPNGAGKTTMLQVASTYLPPSRGTVRVFGCRYGDVDVRDLRKQIGYAGTGPSSLVHQNLPALEIVVTGKHAAFVDSRWHSYDQGDWDTAHRHLARLNADHLSDRVFGALSAGEKQRVLIARSLMSRPRLLLLDEAMTGLDLGLREQLIDSLTNLIVNRLGPPMVLVTHHVEEIPPGFDHIAMLSDGQVIIDGPVETSLTSETLSACFRTPLRVERHEGRFRAWSPH